MCSLLILVILSIQPIPWVGSESLPERLLKEIKVLALADHVLILYMYATCNMNFNLASIAQRERPAVQTTSRLLFKDDASSKPGGNLHSVFFNIATI